jgi:glycyl-tRNA synthetase beta subunit
LENENDRLRKDIDDGELVSKEWHDEQVMQAENRIAELEKENETKTDTITDLLKKQEFYETEKLKQFAERLKDKLKENVNGENVDSCVQCARFIREILDEFMEGANV